MTVTTFDRRIEDDRRREDGSAWLDLGGPAARTVFVGREESGDEADPPCPVPGGATAESKPPATREWTERSDRDAAIATAPRTPLRRPLSNRPRRARGAGARRSGVAACESTATPSLHGARLTRRGRVVMAVAWSVLAAVAAVPIVGAIGGGDPVSPSPTTVSVSAGDTVWGIARSLDPSGDPRELVGAIVNLNDLDSPADIRAGDRLVVPAVP